ncbi:alpha/beta-hydrolase [Tothia fuscella]|uniref:Kynurenine formamidase n=1 Tax=Tothia fuscella TaxID=1048955 RepID=A0A9P4P382_9PEZI|nr:alpha/beta-hydrolase [Tothia fuscella]
MLIRPTYPYHRNSIPYGEEHALQTIDICVPRPIDDQYRHQAVWVVFIHGGAWCDPLQDSKELQPALEQLLKNESYASTLNHIAGFASINYGLSTSKPDDKSLDVKHPQHIQDVIRALGWLRENYGVGDYENDQQAWRYLVVGHSCGATLAMQLCMSYSQSWGHEAFGSWTGSPPVAVVGLEGIYDLSLLNRNHIDQPFYAQFLAGAFRSNQKLWDEVSPVHGNYDAAYKMKGMKLVVLAHSDEDELVEWEQATTMKSKLVGSGWKDYMEGSLDADTAAKQSGSERQVRILKLTGLHDEIWSKGSGVRIAIESTIRALFV